MNATLLTNYFLLDVLPSILSICILYHKPCMYRYLSIPFLTNHTSSMSFSFLSVSTASPSSLLFFFTLIPHNFFKPTIFSQNLQFFLSKYISGEEDVINIYFNTFADRTAYAALGLRLKRHLPSKF